MSASTLGPYQLIKSIGSGGMAEVWSANRPPQTTLVAVKVLTRGLGVKELTSFRREVRSVARMQHPHIVQIFDQGRAKPGEAYATGTPWFAMEVSKQGTLRRHRGKMAWPEVRQTLTQLLSALSHAHARGVIHRDIKPDNVLWTDRGALLTDFGLAAERRNSSPSEDGQLGGSPAFMAPEQFNAVHMQVGPWTDLYGLGCLAWSLVTGHPPFPGLVSFEAFRNAHRFTDLPPLKPAQPVPIEFESWLRTLLRKSPADRPLLAADAAYALSKLPDTCAPIAGASLSPFTPDADTWFDVPDDTPVTIPRISNSPTQMKPPPLPEDWRTMSPPTQGAAVGRGLLGLREPPVVGREFEQAQLWQALTAVHQTQKPQALILRAQPGLGSGRLAVWLGRSAHEAGAAWTMQTTHSPVDLPAAGLSWMIANLYRCGPVPTAEALDWVKHSPKLADLTDPLDQAIVARAIGTLHAGEAQLPTDQNAALDVVIRILTARRPVLVWLDRAEYGQSSLAFAERILREHDRPVIFVICVREDPLAARPEEQAALGRLEELDNVRTLHLDRIHSDEHLALVTSMLPIEPELARRIADRCEGHPGFAAEMIRELLFSGALEPHGELWHANQPIVLPQTWHEAWERRIDEALKGLQQSNMRALEIVSMLWPDIMDETWTDICTRTGVLDPQSVLEPLWDRGLARRHTDERGWSLAPGLRDALFKRVEHDPLAHRICAEVVRAREGGKETWAHHLVASGQHRAAIDPLFDAAKERVLLGHLASAWTLLEQHENALKMAPTTDPRRGDNTLLRCRVCRFQGDLEAATHWAHRAKKLGERHQWQDILTGAEMAFGAIAGQRGRNFQAVEHLREAESRLLIRAHSDNLLPDCRVHLSGSLMSIGRLDEAQDVIELAIDGYQRANNQLGLANSLLALGGLQLRTAKLELAQETLHTAAEIYRLQGVRFGLAEADNRLGEAARLREDHQTAATHYRRALSGLTSIGSNEALIPRLNLGVLQIDQGRFAEAAALLTPGLTTANKMGRPDLQNAVKVMLLPCLADAQDWVTFDHYLRDAKNYAQRTGSVQPDLARLCEQAAQVCLAKERVHRAKQAAKMSLNLWRRLSRTDDTQRLRDLLAKLEDL